MWSELDSLFHGDDHIDFGDDIDDIGDIDDIDDGESDVDITYWIAFSSRWMDNGNAIIPQ